MTATRVMDSPLGPILLTAEAGALTGLHFRDDLSVSPKEWVVGRDGGDDAEPDEQVVAEAERQLREYFAGQRVDFDLPLAPEGTAFQSKVWAALQRIPYGETWSYGRLATEIGQPTASRAVGLANGRNPIAIVIPCHRVIGANGTLTGYASGTERKRWLLDLETPTLL
ncbi:MAG: methylated-DNA--[protein]-cysteine S-methyltransferase [Actinomycetales bacterium]